MGAGIKAGAPLSMNLVYASGIPEVSQEMQAFKSALSLAGMQLNLSQQPAGDIFSLITPCTPSSPACKWQRSTGEVIATNGTSCPSMPCACSQA